MALPTDRIGASTPPPAEDGQPLREATRDLIAILRSCLDAERLARQQAENTVDELREHVARLELQLRARDDKNPH